MFKKINKRILMIGVIAVMVGSIAIFAARQLKEPSTTGMMNGMSITINKDVEFTQTDGRDYIIIPVNTDFKNVTIKVNDNKDIELIPELEEMLEGLDTLTPRELNYTIESHNLNIDVNFIISDDLR